MPVPYDPCKPRIETRTTFCKDCGDTVIVGQDDNGPCALCDLWFCVECAEECDVCHYMFCYDCAAIGHHCVEYIRRRQNEAFRRRVGMSQINH